MPDITTEHKHESELVEAFKLQFKDLEFRNQVLTDQLKLTEIHSADCPCKCTRILDVNGQLRAEDQLMPETKCENHQPACIFDHDKVGQHTCVMVCFNCRTCSHGRRWPHCCGVIEVPESRNA